MTIVGSVIDHEGAMPAETSDYFEGYRGDYQHDELMDLALYFVSGAESRGLHDESAAVAVMRDVDNQNNMTLNFILPGKRSQEPIARRVVLALTETPAGEVFGDNTALTFSLTNHRQRVEGFSRLQDDDHAELETVKGSLEKWLLAGRKVQMLDGTVQEVA